MGLLQIGKSGQNYEAERTGLVNLDFQDSFVGKSLGIPGGVGLSEGKKCWKVGGAW